MKNLVFSRHAVEQMQKRNIAADEVAMIVDHPDGSFAQSRDKQILYKRFSKRKDNLIAAVVVSQTASALEVITVMHNFEVRK
jgi:hypothetical protein